MAVRFDKIGRTLTLSQEIELQIEDVIRKKEYSTGDKLPTEKEMCEMFGVSRTALREALRMLSARGLINIRKGSGTYVSDFTSQNVARPMNLYLELNLDKEYVLHVVQVRKFIEPEIAKLAAVNRTEKDLILLKENLNAFSKCKSSDHKKQGDLDRQFHLIISRASGNKVFPLIVDPIFHMMPRIRTMVYTKISQAQSSALEYHRKIVQAIEDKNADEAYDMMLKHLEIATMHSEEIVKDLN